MSEAIQHNAQDLEQELSWLSRVIDTRLKLYFGQEAEVNDVFDLAPPNLEKALSEYARIVNQFRMTFAERLCLILALVPHIRPRVLDVFYTKNKVFDRKFTEFGGIREGSEGDFSPTGETLAFLLAGQDLAIRFALIPILGRDHFFTRHNILHLEAAEAGYSPLKAPLRLTEEYLSYFTTGETYRPQFSRHFPARPIETHLDWRDLVLQPGTLAMVREIESWINHGDTLLNDWQMAGKIRPGFRALFYGPPGAGKILTACLLGKSTGREVYRIDLSAVLSGFIGETEKNLSRVFNMAENKQWILLFDEADALFGKRSGITDAHHRYANQELSYLLQRLKDFTGIAILASNLSENFDKAFTQHFESIISFPMPGPRERRRLWQQGFSPKAQLAPDIQLDQLADKFELSGGAIMNVIRFASLQALERGDGQIRLQDLNQGIKREFAREERMG